MVFMTVNSTSLMTYCLFFPVSDRNYELNRSQIELGEKIGDGQFGDVHRGIFKPRPDKSVINVAVKTCKGDTDLATAEKFWEEACEFNVNKFYLLD